MRMLSLCSEVFGMGWVALLVIRARGSAQLIHHRHQYRFTPPIHCHAARATNFNFSCDRLRGLACIKAFLLIPGRGRLRPLGASRPWPGRRPALSLWAPLVVCSLLCRCLLIGSRRVLVGMMVDSCCHYVAQGFDHSDSDISCIWIFRVSRQKRTGATTAHPTTLAIYLASVVAERAVNRPAEP